MHSPHAARALSEFQGYLLSGFPLCRKYNSPWSWFASLSSLPSRRSLCPFTVMQVNISHNIMLFLYFLFWFIFLSPLTAMLLVALSCGFSSFNSGGTTPYFLILDQETLSELSKIMQLPLPSLAIMMFFFICLHLIHFYSTFNIL